jgi:hypothetical protein
VSPLALLTISAGVEFKWLPSHSDERPPYYTPLIDDLVGKLEIIAKITTESWGSLNQAGNFADAGVSSSDADWNRRKTSVDWLEGTRVGVSRNEILNFSDDFLPPLIVAIEIKESPAGWCK